MKRDGWDIDRVKEVLPEGYLVEEEQKRNDYGFLRCIKFVKHNKDGEPIYLVEVGGMAQVRPPRPT